MVSLSQRTTPISMSLTFGAISPDEKMARNFLRILRIADLLREHGIDAIRVLFESGQRGAVFDVAAKPLDMLAQNRLGVVLAQQCAVHLE